MYVAVRRYEGVSDPQRVAKVAQEDFVPIISELPGFVAHYTLDAGDGVIVSTSVFEHKDAVRSRRTLWQESSCRSI